MKMYHPRLKNHLINSKIPSLSSSKSVTSGTPSPSVSVKQAATPDSKWSAVPELSVSAGVVYPSPPGYFSVCVNSCTVYCPSSSASVKPASKASEHPSPSASVSKWSGVPSLSVSWPAHTSSFATGVNKLL